MEQAKLRELISQMTLEEKAGMCSGQDFLAYQGGRTSGYSGVYGQRRTARTAQAG